MNSEQGSTRGESYLHGLAGMMMLVASFTFRELVPPTLPQPSFMHSFCCDAVQLALPNEARG